MKRYFSLIKNPFFILTGITIAFFWMTFFKGNIPFPADLLLAEYNPWRHSDYFGYVAGSIPHKAQYFDVIRELYPWKTLVIDELKSGHIPLWNPYNFSGAPLMANYQSQVWYPLSFIYLVLPQPLAWTVLIILQVLLGLIFTYLFARSIKLTTAASILAAVLFNVSSFSTVWLEFNTVWHTILWIPLILYIFEQRLTKTLSWKWQLLFVFALFSSMTAGHPQDFINSLLFISTYILARLAFLPNKHAKAKMVIALELGLLALMTLSIAGIQLLPTIQLFLTSARIPHDVNFVVRTMLIQGWQLPIALIADFFGNPATRTYVLPDTYVNKSLSIGSVGFLLVVVSFWAKKSYHFKFFAVIAVFLLLLATNNPVSVLFYRFPLPILSTGTPTRSLFIYIFCISMLAAIGYDALNSRISIKKPLLLLGVLFTGIFVAYIAKPSLLYPFTEVTVTAMRKSYVVALVLVTAAVGSIIVSQKYRLARLGIILIATVELFWGFTKFNAFVPPAYVFPPSELFGFLQTHAGINRFWGYGTAQIEANFATQYGLYSPDGTDPLNLKWYNSFIQSSRDGHLHQEFTRSTRSDAYIHPGYGENDLPSNTFRLRLMDMMGIKYVLDRAENPKNNETFPQKRYKEIWRQDDWIVYENLSAAPRFFTTSDVRPYSNDKDFENQLFSENFYPDKTVLLENHDYQSLPHFTQHSAQTRLLSYAPETIEFLVESDTPQFLYISDTYDTGWTAEINSKPVYVYKANYAFRGIVVPSGQSRISFTYQPKSFTMGVQVSIAALCVFIAYLFYLKRKTNNRERLKN